MRLKEKMVVYVSEKKMTVHQSQINGECISYPAQLGLNCLIAKGNKCLLWQEGARWQMFFGMILRVTSNALLRLCCTALDRLRWNKVGGVKFS